MANIGEMLSNVKKGTLKPTLSIHASVNSPMKGLNGPCEPMSSLKYEKEEIVRLKKEVKGIEDALDNWIPEDVAAKAKRSLELELEVKLARLLECKARLKQAEAENEEVDESEEDEE